MHLKTKSQNVRLNWTSVSKKTEEVPMLDIGPWFSTQFSILYLMLYRTKKNLTLSSKSFELIKLDSLQILSVSRSCWQQRLLLSSDKLILFLCIPDATKQKNALNDWPP